MNNDKKFFSDGALLGTAIFLLTSQLLVKNRTMFLEDKISILNCRIKNLKKNFELLQVEYNHLVNINRLNTIIKQENFKKISELKKINLKDIISDN